MHHKSYIYTQTITQTISTYLCKHCNQGQALSYLTQRLFFKITLPWAF